ncbi:2'-5' RNA ligase family protein [Sphingomonas sp. RS2018]
MRYASRPLYLLAKPHEAAAEVMRRLPWMDPRRPAELLHVTMLSLGDAADLPVWALDDLRRRLAAIRSSPFRLIFDRVVANRRHATLLPSEPLPHASAARQALIAALDARAAFRRDPPFRPHVTLAYRCDVVVDAAIDPIAWLVDEIVLVESIVGEARHVELGRFPLLREAQVPMRAA